VVDGIKEAFTTIQNERKAAVTSKDQFKEELRKRFVPTDLHDFEGWFRRYNSLFDEIQEIKPKKIVEIGVRAGYSAFTMLSAAPEAHLIAIDADIDPTKGNSHGGFLGAWRHAESILAGMNFDLMLVDSHALLRLPFCDIVYVDGDHTPEGAYQDLQLAAQSACHILVDDYDTVFHSKGEPRFEVREAVDRFVKDYGHLIKSHKHIPNGSTGMYRIDLG
jgi:hypothetical protein